MGPLKFCITSELRSHPLPGVRVSVGHKTEGTPDGPLCQIRFHSEGVTEFFGTLYPLLHFDSDYFYMD